MKLLICDRCGCTDKPFKGSLVAPTREEIEDDGSGRVYSFHQVEGFDLCGPCFHLWWAVYQNTIEIFLASVKCEYKKGDEREL